VIEMLRSEAEGDHEDEKEAYVRREFERHYGFPFYEDECKEDSEYCD
jgi:hypothetical protein